MAEMTGALWRLAHMLAADLALNRVSKNLVQNILTYTQYHPGTSVVEYVARLQQLNETGHFQAGKSGPYEREDLYNAVQRVQTWPDDEKETRLVLAWVTRLIDYYAEATNRLAVIRLSQLRMLDVQPGQHLSGKVRKADKNNVWVRVQSGQWGCAQRKGDIEIGDEVDVSVRRVTNPATFDVDIVAVTRRVPRRPPASPPPAQTRPDAEISPERDAEISAAANNFMAFLQKEWAKEGK